MSTQWEEGTPAPLSLEEHLDAWLGTRTTAAMTETTLSGRTSPTVRQCCALGNPYAKESSQAGEHPYSWTYLGSGWAPDHLKISRCKLSYAGATHACYLLCRGQAGICCGRRNTGNTGNNRKIIGCHRIQQISMDITVTTPVS